MSSIFFFFSSRRRHTRFDCDWSSDVCSSDLRRAARITRSRGHRPGLSLDLGLLPVLGKLSQSLFMQGPVVQRGRIEVRSVGPDQRLDFPIDPNLVKQFHVTQGAVQLACENRAKIDRLLGSVVKANAQRV